MAALAPPSPLPQECPDTPATGLPLWKWCTSVVSAAGAAAAFGSGLAAAAEGGPQPTGSAGIGPQPPMLSAGFFLRKSNIGPAQKTPSLGEPLALAKED
eukprot:CAMPEP_0115432032 /NCGR_PEP_ID=MMETSP0271-20121206/31881_1 /TAXON_ID=71861 /ORGANISM="Scrippsiella trochoidea, Strain CCMP3099" /LENGTH=98 /DNA_ID=CAMNT_0002857339 /DNA_START=123 /DNA_END=419 /DNA_ORIENTATION=-